MNANIYPNDCQPLLFNISSNGLWENLKSPDVIFRYSLPLMEIQILLILVCIIMSHMCFKCIGISHYASYIVAGLLMGPQCFDLREKSSKKLSWDPVINGNAALKGFSVCATTMFTFLMAVKINRRVVFNTGRLPIVIGVLTFILPAFVGRFGFRNLRAESINPYYMHKTKALVERSVIIGTQSSIVLPTITYILSELKILNSEFGRFALSASIVNDVVVIIFLIPLYVATIYKALAYTTLTTYIDIIAVILFFLIPYFVFRPAAQWIVQHTPDDKPVADKYVNAVILTVLASTVYSIHFNMKFLGPFVIGLIIPDGPPLGSTLEAKYEKLTMNVFLPISIAFSTMRCDIMSIIYQLDDILYNIFSVALTLFLKLIAGLVPCLYCKLPLKESFALSILLSCRGSTEIFLFELMLDDSGTYSFIIIFVLLNCGIVPSVLSSLYDPKRKYTGYQEKNILTQKPNSDLRILTCVHTPDNISGFIAFLQLLSSSKHDLPIVVTVLHLKKLVGQMFPVLISHNKKSKQLINNSYINNAIITFSQFNQESFNSTIVKMFTALSHENLMHDDICMLALDHTTSIIIVPSGRTWTLDGVFQSDDESIRRVNMSLLGSAPCSIGILVDRGQFLHRRQRRNNINVGVIFIGGKDDREAFALGNRMKHNTMVRVTVIRFIPNQETELTNLEDILDQEIIKELKYPKVTNNISYIEISVTGGPEVATTVRSLAEEYDLMIVGREHGPASPDFSGITEWVELPELGVNGDLLAVRDLESRVSVLVVQQQHLS